MRSACWVVVACLFLAPVLAAQLPSDRSALFKGTPCLDEVMFSQERDLDEPLGQFYSSDEATGITRADAFEGLANPIAVVEWVGSTVDAQLAPCIPAANSIEITFYADVAGAPAGKVAQQTVTPERVGLAWRALLNQPVGLAKGWISIRSLGDPECGFTWSSANSGNGQFATSVDGGALELVNDADLAFTLSGGSRPILSRTSCSSAPTILAP